MLTRMSDSPKSNPRARASVDGSGSDPGGAGEEGPGVLAGLPRTRPQRASARRAAARAGGQRKASATPRAAGTRHAPTATLPVSTRTTPAAPRPEEPRTTPAVPRPEEPRTTPAVPRPEEPRTTPARPASKRKPTSNPRATKGRGPGDEPAPLQGFEAEPDTFGGPVQPPGGIELVASAAELTGELAKAGITTGARLLKDFLSRLPG